MPGTPHDPDGDVCALVRLLDEGEPDRASLVRTLAARGWTAARVERAIARALADGRVFEDCRHDLQSAPSQADSRAGSHRG